MFRIEFILMKFVVPPTLYTDRLILKAHSENDLDDCVQLWSDPVVTRYTSGTPIARQDVWTRLLRHSGHWTLLGFGYWLVFERLSGRFVGEVGIARFKRSVVASLPELDVMPEAGWVLLPWAHGQGYGAEAVKAVLEWRDQHVPISGTFCLVASENLPSLRLAEKFGFRPYTTANDNHSELLILLRS
jgi:RimJ/RimL family protein N-acetyltransferase